MTLRPTRTLAAALALAAVANVATGAPSIAAATTLRPVDQAARDPGFLRFRRQLQKIVARRDIAALRRHLHPRILFSFGGENGVKNAAKIMRDDPKRWAILARILRNGGKFTTAGSGKDRRRMFFAPYTYFAELPGGVGAYDVVTVVGTRVNVRARPSASAPVIAKLSHQVVRVVWSKQGRRTKGWTRIKLADGRTGYVRSSFAKSPVDYRAGFVKYKGRWVMSVFVAGD